MPATSSSSKDSRKIVLIAGEQSGDNHGFALMNSLKALDPSLIFMGVGGPKMRSAMNVELGSSEELQIMGFTSLVTALPRILRFQKRLQKAICKENPESVITIDFPDFNTS